MAAMASETGQRPPNDLLGLASPAGEPTAK